MTELNIVQHRFDSFRSLMPHRIREILLVSSVYDAYVLEEDGGLEERIWEQYMEHGLSSVPRIRKASSIEASLAIIENETVDLVLTIVHDDDDLALELAGKVKALKPQLPVVFLITDPMMLETYTNRRVLPMDRVFLWQNDPSLLLAIVKNFEDQLNVAHDTKTGKVRVILLVEDSVSHYSLFLPMMYTAIMKLTRQLMDDGLNHLHKQLRMRSRAKIILVDNFEDALRVYKEYQSYLLGVITDVRFWSQGELDAEAGIKLAKHFREGLPELPICIQSAEPDKNRKRAIDLDAHFLDKSSNHLLDELECWLMEFMGFGDFIFRNDQAEEVCRANSPRELMKCLETVPIDVVVQHARHQDFSHWMMARTEIKIAERLYPARIDDFAEMEGVRRFLIQVIGTELDEKQSDVVTVYSPSKDPNALRFMRLGDGSLGGKARGISFLRYLLARQEIRLEFPDVLIQIPSALVICSDIFQQFMHKYDLWEFCLNEKTEHIDIQNRFLELPDPQELAENLTNYLKHVTVPLAIRSSSILEDSRNLPLAGLYSTFMLRNNEESLDARLAALLRAIKLVWASTFGDDPKAYFQQTPYHLRDERMSVVIQNLGGDRHDDHFYPTFSGVAQSHNFYPISYMKPEDGVVQIALGLGKTVVEGGPIVRFCPKYPQILPQFVKIRDWLYFTQKYFYALDMKCVSSSQTSPISDDDLRQLPIEVAEKHGVLQHVASVYQGDSDLLVDSFFYEGPRIITFAKVLRDPKLQLGKLLGKIMKDSESAMRTPVEIEFAVDLGHNGKPIFYPLQLRPMTSKRKWESVQIDKEAIDKAICYSNQAHGNGVIDSICDIVFVAPEEFDKTKTREIAMEIGTINRQLVEQNRPYLLIGFGRWGSVDPSMGIGVKWSQISGVKVMVEVGLPDFNVDPAQGTHFFQNVTSLNIGCLSIPNETESRLDWEWLRKRSVKQITAHLKHVRLNDPLEIRIDGRKGEAVVLHNT